MKRTFELAGFFLLVVIFQVFLFHNLDLSVYVYPLFYISFLVLLPMQTSSLMTLAAGLALGASVDALTGAAAVNTVACLLTAFLRPYLMYLFIGKEMVGDGGFPTAHRIGTGKFLRYAATVILLHSTVVFSLDSLSASFFYLTVIKIAASSLLTLALVWLMQLIFSGEQTRRIPTK